MHFCGECLNVFYQRCSFICIFSVTGFPKIHCLKLSFHQGLKLPEPVIFSAPTVFCAQVSFIASSNCNLGEKSIESDTQGQLKREGAYGVY